MDSNGPPRTPQFTPQIRGGVDLELAARWTEVVRSEYFPVSY
jgi:hypothetical protein